MKAEVRVLCGPAVAAGFRLAGLAPVEAADPDEGVQLLRSLMSDSAVGVILVEEPIHSAMPPAMQREVARAALPMLVPFPGPAWGAVVEETDGFIAALLRQAIGYRVKFG